jgi:very-short-patch-repair endonuclease
MILRRNEATTRELGFLQAAGYRVIRVRNRDVSREPLEAVLRTALGSNR